MQHLTIEEHLNPPYSDTNSDTGKTILIIEDSHSDQLLYQSWIRIAYGSHYRCIEAHTIAASLDVFAQDMPQCIIMDFIMGDGDGFQLLDTLKATYASLPPIIFVTGMCDELIQESAIAYGVHCYLNKQWLMSKDLQHAINTAFTIHPQRINHHAYPLPG